MTEVLAIVQARSSSTRLPGKVMAPVAGQPMVLRQLERIKRCTTLDRMVVATSVHPSDDVLARTLEDSGIQVRRGPLDDVLGRFAAVVQEFDPSTIVRLTADCPLTDPEVIDAVVSRHLDSGADYTSNTLVRTYPHGLDVEALSSDAFERLLRLDLDSNEREHVTLGVYRRPERFKLESVTQSEDRSSLRWTVDYPEDLEFVRAVYNELYDANPDFTSADILQYLSAYPDSVRTVNDV